MNIGEIYQNQLIKIFGKRWVKSEFGSSIIILVHASIAILLITIL